MTHRELIGAPAACKLLGVGRSTLNWLIEKGDLRQAFHYRHQTGREQKREQLLLLLSRDEVERLVSVVASLTARLKPADRR